MGAVYPSGRAVTPGTVPSEMSATVKATGLAAGHGDRVLFSGLDLVVAPGDVVGLVGRERRRASPRCCASSPG